LLAIACAAEADALVLVNPLPPAPWHAALPVRDAAALVPWRARASLVGTRRALPDASDADALFAFRHWRDESGAVLDDARAGIAIAAPACPTLMIASARDDDTPAAGTRAMAQAFAASLLELDDASHAGPLLGRDAAAVAAHVVTWLNVKIA
jgi:pimeloyl-ACP methyl ester carboxylesterase